MLSRGERVGEYEIEAEIGEGGMARVYRARHTILDTVHAVKVLEPKYRADPETRKRFLAEAKIQAKHLGHENIVKVTNIVATKEHAALVMELVEGPDLEKLAGKVKDPGEIKEIFTGVLAGVGSAHAEKIIHRDLKPANVLLQKKSGGGWLPKVTDFGVAKVTEPIDGKGKQKKRSTAADARMGTLHYMSPEQIRRAKDVTERSDIFSLGAMLYELVTGEVPFNGQSDFDIMEKIVNGKYVPPGDLVKQLDEVLDEVIHKALSPDPAKRYGSCEEMSAALRGPDRSAVPGAAATASAAAATNAPATPRARAASAAETAGRSKAGLAIVGAGLVVAVGAVVFYATRGKGSSDKAPSAADQPVAEAAETAGPTYDDDLPPLATYDPETGETTPTPDHVPVGVAVTSPPDAAPPIGMTADMRANPTSTSFNDSLTFGAKPKTRLEALSEPGGSDTVAPEPSSRLEALAELGGSRPTPGAKPIFTPLKPEPPAKKTPRPCSSGSYQSGVGLNIRLTGSRGTCGSYAFSEITRAGARSCAGSLTRCSEKDGAIAGRFECSYSAGASQRLKGSMRLTCSGKSMRARVKTDSGSRNWKLSR